MKTSPWKLPILYPSCDKQRPVVWALSVCFCLPWALNNSFKVVKRRWFGVFFRAGTCWSHGINTFHRLWWFHQNFDGNWVGSWQWLHLCAGNSSVSMFRSHTEWNKMLTTQNFLWNGNFGFFCEGRSEGWFFILSELVYPSVWFFCLPKPNKPREIKPFYRIIIFWVLGQILFSHTLEEIRNDIGFKGDAHDLYWLK